jgi:threonine dehydrogenase-like Zn-dependent dehydrogenase
LKVITVEPGVRDSVRLEERPEPPSDSSSLLVQALALGVCGTDREIISGAYGAAPAGAARLVLGHESLGRVLEAPADSDLVSGWQETFEAFEDIAA